MKVHLGVAAGLTLGLVACASAPTQTPQLSSFRWDVNSPFATFKGTPNEQGAQVDSALANTSRVTSMTLFVAADTAYSLGRIEDAGFLYHAANVRGFHDLQRFPPIGSGGNSPGAYLGFLRNNAGQAINPSLTEDPAHFIAASARFAQWDCSVIAGYNPGWEYQSKSASAEPCETVRDERAKPMLGIATLLSNPEYASAFQVAKRYNQATRENQAIPEAKTAHDQAVQTMLAIEKATGIEGFAGYAR